jgi:predicted RNA methylase
VADPGEACRPLGGPTSPPVLQFEFGKNWRRFLGHLTPDRIAEAEASLVDMLETGRLDGKRFLDVGSGSGLFSLAARRLGARVHSFDRDRDSVECTRALRRGFRAW